jgi:hypothetical protein
MNTTSLGSETPTKTQRFWMHIWLRISAYITQEPASLAPDRTRKLVLKVAVMGLLVGLGLAFLIQALLGTLLYVLLIGLIVGGLAMKLYSRYEIRWPSVRRRPRVFRG